MLSMARPWEDQNEKYVEMDLYNGGIKEIREQVNAANVKWDVVDFEYSDLIQACEEGLLEKVDQAAQPPGAAFMPLRRSGRNFDPHHCTRHPPAPS